MIELHRGRKDGCQVLTYAFSRALYVVSKKLPGRENA
jgi:hypothetical protein